MPSTGRAGIGAPQRPTMGPALAGREGGRGRGGGRRSAPSVSGRRAGPGRSSRGWRLAALRRSRGGYRCPGKNCLPSASLGSARRWTRGPPRTSSRRASPSSSMSVASSATSARSGGSGSTTRSAPAGTLGAPTASRGGRPSPSSSAAWPASAHSRSSACTAAAWAALRCFRRPTPAQLAAAPAAAACARAARCRGSARTWSTGGTSSPAPVAGAAWTVLSQDVSVWHTVGGQSSCASSASTSGAPRPTCASTLPWPAWRPFSSSGPAAATRR
mmetsp:Transcript_56214/g.164257  ORF Transcript_56214/g.164257 Transcript_56214/m.164257 type:complete len:273 (-) Transcript_56214:312-1130(-)